MQEYLICHGGKWWHFFIKPFYGLCYRKKEGGRFLHFEVLLSDACEDFCAISAGGGLHLICQDKCGNIIHLSYDENSWQKITLLTSKAERPYPKYFRLLSMSGYLNLFYVISYKEKHMLIHQILGMEDRPPMVVDHISLSRPPFLAAAHSGTEITLLYENEHGVSGTRQFRWSQKAFGGFVPVHPAAGCKVRSLHVEPDDRALYAGFVTMDEVTNLVVFEKKRSEDFSEPVTVYLDCAVDAMPIFCKNEEKLYLVWQEKGCIMSSFSLDGGSKWSKPIRYMKGASLVPILYHLQDDSVWRVAYGYGTERDMVLYAVPPLEEVTEKRPHIQKEGQAVADFATRMGVAESVEHEPELPFAVVKQLREEVAKLKEQFFALRMELEALRREEPKIMEEKAEIEENAY